MALMEPIHVPGEGLQGLAPGHADGAEVLLAQALGLVASEPDGLEAAPVPEEEAQEQHRAKTQKDEQLPFHGAKLTRLAVRLPRESPWPRHD